MARGGYRKWPQPLLSEIATVFSEYICSYAKVAICGTAAKGVISCKTDERVSSSSGLELVIACVIDLFLNGGRACWIMATFISSGRLRQRSRKGEGLVKVSLDARSSYAATRDSPSVICVDRD